MGPQKAAQIFLKRHPDAAGFEVTLYGSLAATGKGHMTDKVIEEVLSPVAPVNIDWQPQKFLPFHPNGMEFVARDPGGNVLEDWTVYSIGGGALSEGKGVNDPFRTKDIYAMNSLTEIRDWCDRNGRSYWEYVQQCEDAGIWDYLRKVWLMMQDSVERGLNHEGVLPGPLNLPRKAANYYIKASGYKPSLQSRGMVFAYALAVSEENASGEMMDHFIKLGF
jgi:L-serine dehydratase